MASTTLALVLNAGSSSLKYGLFRQEQPKSPELEMLCVGLCDKIGLEGTVIKHTVGDNTTKTLVKLADHKEALANVIEILTAAGGPVKDVKDVQVIGHRVVHGGAKFSQPTVVDETSEAEIEACTVLAPLHNPANLMGIREAKALFPWAKQVAVFDTAFHATMPDTSYRYALPKELYEKHAVRKYGFHGTSYKYVSATTALAFGMPLEELNMVICHLGNGASMACLQNGKVIDTTMGLTPLEGLMMGTRSGDVDPGVLTYLSTTLGMGAKDVDTLLNKKSGLLGVAGKSDMREVIAAAAAGDPDAILARGLFAQRIRKYLGAYLVKLNGRLDALVFTAGVGEGDRGLRKMVCEGLGTLGIDIDVEKNATLDAGEVQSVYSHTKVMVVPTDEERSIAAQSLEVCGLVDASMAKAVTDAPGSTLREVMLPRQLLHSMSVGARASPQHILLPEGEDVRTIAAAGEVLARGLCTLTILGPPGKIAEHAKAAGVSLGAARIIDPATANIDGLVGALCEARKLTPQQATDLIRGDTTWFGVMMLHTGQVDGVVTGACHASSDVMRPVLQVIKGAPGVATVSSLFFMLLGDGVRLISDGGLLANPTTDQMAETAMLTAKTARAFGIEPRIAMLSYATGAAEKGEMIEKVREATAKAKALGPNEMIEGPIQYDAAVNPAIAAQKFKTDMGPVPGRASVCIFPDLDAGNIGYKIMQQSSGCIAIGPIMQGLRLPINDLSRGSTVQDIVSTIIVTCLQSIQTKKAAPASKL